MVEKCAGLIEELIRNGEFDAQPFVFSEKKSVNNLEKSSIKPKRLNFANANSPSRNIELLQSNLKSNARFSIALRQSTCPLETEDNDILQTESEGDFGLVWLGLSLRELHFGSVRSIY